LTRHRFAVLALVVVALASSLWSMLDVFTLYSLSERSNVFGVPAFEHRFEILHQSLGPHSVLGYVTDNPGSDTQAQAEFYLTQYALAPAIIKASTDEQFVVGNFHTNSPDRTKLQAKNLVFVKDFGNDVFLYRNTTR
jgi:hypothetical protein